MGQEVQTHREEGIALVLAGRAAFKAGDHVSSERDFLAALAFGVEETDCRLHLARIFNARQDWQKSIEQWLWLRDNDPDRLEPHLQVARACFRLGRLAEARGEFEAVLGIEPDHKEARDRLGALLLAQSKEAVETQDFDNAEKLLLAALERGIDEAGCRRQLARLYSAISNWPAALEQWLWLHRESASDIEIRLQIARVYVRLGRRGEAKVEYEAILKLEPGEERAKVRLGALLVSAGHVEFAAGNFRRSEQDFVAALELGADEATCREHLAQIYSQAQSWSKALGHQRRLAAVKPDDLAVRVEYARLCFRAGELDEAGTAFNAALAAGAAPLDCHTSLARIYEERRDWALAADHWGKVLELEPSRVEAHLRQARAYFGLKRFDEARQGFENVLSVAPQQPEAREALARLEAIVARSGNVGPTEQPASWMTRVPEPLRWLTASELLKAEVGALEVVIQTAQRRVETLAELTEVYRRSVGPAGTHRELYGLQADRSLTEFGLQLRKVGGQVREFVQRTSKVVERVAGRVGGSGSTTRIGAHQVPMASPRAMVRDAINLFRKQGMEPALDRIFSATRFEEQLDLLIDFGAALRDVDREAAARIYWMAYALAPSEITATQALQVSAAGQDKTVAPLAEARLATRDGLTDPRGQGSDWKPFSVTVPLPAPRYVPGDLGKVAATVSNIVLRSMEARIEKLGIARSGAGEHYSRLVKSGQGILDYDLAAARVIVGQFGTNREVHEIGSGIGGLSLLLAAMAVPVVGVESQVARHQSCAAALELFRTRWDRPAAPVRFISGRFPQCMADVDVTNKIAVLTGFIASVTPQERAQIIVGLRRYGAVVIDTFRFLTSLKSEEEQDQLLHEFQEAGFKHFYEAARSDSFRLVILTAQEGMVQSAAESRTVPAQKIAQGRAKPARRAPFATILADAVSKGGAGDSATAAKLIRHALISAGGSFDSCMLAVEAALDVDELEVAAEACKAAHALRPDSDRAIRRMAQVAEAQGDLPGALVIWRRARQRNPTVPHYCFNELRLAASLGEVVTDLEIFNLMVQPDWFVEAMFASAAFRGTEVGWRSVRDCLNGVFEVHCLTRLEADDEPWRGFESLHWQVAAPGKVSDAVVSVVIPAYNARQTIVAAVRSILGQTHSNVEVIVVDDGSTDATVDVLLGALGGDPRVHIEMHSQNAGTYPAINTGLALSSGAFVCILGADDVSHPQRLQLQLEAIEKSDSVAALCRYVRISEEGSLVANPNGVTALCDSSLMFRREIVLERLGFMDMTCSVTEDEKGRPQVAMLLKNNSVIDDKAR